MASSKRPSNTAKHKPTHKPTPKPAHKPKPVHKGPQPAVGQPVFAQPKPSPDPTGFVDTTSDAGDYSLVNATLMQPYRLLAAERLSRCSRWLRCWAMRAQRRWPR